MPESSNPFTEIFNNSNEIQEERKKAISEYNKGNYDVAFRLFSKLSKNGDSESQFYLGLMYANGQGVEQSYEEAVKWYRKSAYQGNAGAQNNLGVKYANGQGVEQSYEEAVKWYRKSADQGNAWAQNNLGLSYEYGQGVEQSYEEAVGWFRKSADQGNAGAQNNLGFMYENGQGVEQSYEEAVKWYRKSADQGSAQAQCNLGFMYENGYGVETSLSKALELYRQSYDNGRTGSKDDIDRLESMIDSIEGTVKNDLEKSSGYSTRPSPKAWLHASNDSKTSCPNNDSTNGFDEIFKRLTAEEFMEDPTRILSLMMDFGFDPRQVRLLRTVMTEDMKEVKDFLRSPTGTGYEIAEGIAEYCLVSEDALKDILDGIRSSLNGDIKTEVIDDDRFGRCRISLDGIAKYSPDMTVLLWVKEDISEFRIPDSVTEIGRNAFRNCTSLKEVHIPDSLTWIGRNAFRNCTSLKEVHIPDSVTGIGFDAFEGCTSLKEVHIPDSVTEIGDYAFSDCESLEEVYIPDSVTEIGDYAFDGCTSVHFIVDPNNKHFYSKSGELCRR